MKNFVLGILIFVVGGTIFFVSRSNKNATNHVSASPTISSASSTDFVLAVLSPDVFIKNLGQSNFVKVDKETKIVEGSEIKTSSSGKASILYPNGTISNIKEDSDILIKSLGSKGNQSRLKLIIGGIWSKIKNISGKDEFFEVETQNMVASVRGTILAVGFEKGISWAAVLEHKVDIQALDPKTGAEIKGANTQLNQGEIVEIDNSALPPKDKTLKKGQLSNKDLDRQLIKENINTEIIDTLKPTLTPTSVTPAPSLKPSPTLKILPLQTKTPIYSASPSPSPSVSVIPSSVGSVTSITPTPVSSEPKLESVTPKSINSVSDGSENNIVLNGSNFSTGRNTKQIKQVLLNQISITFYLIDSSTIFAQVSGNITPGIYDVSVVTSAGKTLTLPQALEVK